MNEKYLFSLMSVVLLFLLAYAGVEVAGLQVLFGVIIPYMALIVFLAGFAYRVIQWAQTPVPYKIPTTGGQQKSLPWIQHAAIDCPDTKAQVVGRMAMEVLLFRSLFRNLVFKKEGDKLAYRMELFLWLGAIVFHYAFLVVTIRHLRFFAEPVPFFVTGLEKVDSFLQLGLPVVYMSGIALLAGVLYLAIRRIYVGHTRYISLASDFFPLFLILAIAVTGIMMRYFTKVDIPTVKELTMGLVTFRPAVPEGIGTLFFVHLFLVSVLLAYFPFSKLMHMGGVFFSPTRNMTCNTRAERHVNPWNYPVPVHTYEEYEDDFREHMIEAGLPVEKKE